LITKLVKRYESEAGLEAKIKIIKVGTAEIEKELTERKAKTAEIEAMLVNIKATTTEKEDALEKAEEIKHPRTDVKDN